jgi:phage gp37-like protein
MTFSDIESGLIEAIRAGLPYVPTVETYAGQLEGEIESLPMQWPAVFIVYSASEFSLVDGPNMAETCEFSLLVAAQNLRDQAAVRQDAAEGCYRMITDLLALLTNQRLGLDMQGLLPVRVALVHTSRSITIYGVDVRASFDSAYQWP